MKRFVNILVAMSVAAFGVPVLVSSCVNPEYELSEDNINTDITVKNVTMLKVIKLSQRIRKTSMLQT